MTTLIDLIGLAASIKELSPLLNRLRKTDFTDVFARALKRVLDEQRRFPELPPGGMLPDVATLKSHVVGIDFQRLPLRGCA